MTNPSPITAKNYFHLLRTALGEGVPAKLTACRNRVFSQLVQNGRRARSPPMRSPDKQFRIACEKTLMQALDTHEFRPIWRAIPDRGSVLRSNMRENGGPEWAVVGVINELDEICWGSPFRFRGVIRIIEEPVAWH